MRPPLDPQTKPDYQETSWSLRLLHSLPLVLSQSIPNCQLHLADLSRPIWSCYILVVLLSETLEVGSRSRRIRAIKCRYLLLPLLNHLKHPLSSSSSLSYSEVEFVHAVSAGGSVKILPAV